MPPRLMSIRTTSGRSAGNVSKASSPLMWVPMHLNPRALLMYSAMQRDSSASSSTMATVITMRGRQRTTVLRILPKSESHKLTTRPRWIWFHPCGPSHAGFQWQREGKRHLGAPGQVVLDVKAGAEFVQAPAHIDQAIAVSRGGGREGVGGRRGTGRQSTTVVSDGNHE